MTGRQPLVKLLEGEILIEGFSKSAEILEHSPRDFISYSNRMVSELGTDVVPHLKQWYMAIKYAPAYIQLDGWSSTEVVEQWSPPEDVQQPMADTANETLNHWRRLADQHWKEFQPSRHKALKKAGMLSEALDYAVRQTDIEVNQLIKSGFNPHESFQMVRETYLFPPEEV